VVNVDCTPESTNYIYLLDASNGVFRFDPVSLSLSMIGTLDCPTGESPYSMAVQRNGTAWTVFTDGSLYSFDIKTAKCSATAFQPGQSGFTTFGMGFATMGMSANETLFVSQADTSGGPHALGAIDLNTLALTEVGAYDKIDARAELTGTGDGRLFGAFEGTPYVVAQIDEGSAAILSQAPQDAIQYPPDSSNFAFAFYADQFFLFVGPGSSTDVFLYDPSTGVTTKKMTIDDEIVGAGVSTCARTTKQ
jgi:hypothetical protein